MLSHQITVGDVLLWFACIYTLKYITGSILKALARR